MSAYVNILELRGISKSFGGVHALENVDFSLRPGEIHGLVGENGAGKSTLMKILSGVHPNFSGDMLIRGKSVRFANPKAAKEHGIGMIYQELSSIPPLTVAENLFLGDQPRRMGFVDWRGMRRDAAACLAALGIEADLKKPLEHYPLGYQQLIEIARVTRSGAEILVMDEPTSALSPAEVGHLFQIIQNLRSQGKSIVFISHFIEDVLKICDRVTVLRNGQCVGTFVAASLTKHAVVQAMLGTEPGSLDQGYEGAHRLISSESGRALLTVRNARYAQRLQQLDFEVCEGEILGLYGAMGAGHTLVGECLFGLRRFDEGEIFLDNKPLPQAPPHRQKANGIAYVSSDRTASLFQDAEIYKNVTVAFLKELLKFPMRRKPELKIADDMRARLRVKASSSLSRLRELSGGNQQKIALARWLVYPIRVLILDEPTRGMDVGAKEEVMRIVKELRQLQVAILLISSEPETIIAHSDRILVFSKGAVVAEFRDRVVNKDDLMRCA